MSSALAGGSPSNEVRSEARGAHWVAWIADVNGKPLHSVVLIGETQTIAEQGARRWAEQIALDIAPV